MTKSRVRNHRFLRLLMGALPVLACLHAAHAADLRRAYIVQLAEPPVASYRGDISGLRATMVATGQRLDVSSTPARQYQGYLSGRQDQVKALLPAAAITHQYQVVFNGFAARLTEAEVRTLKASGKTLRIVPDQRQRVITNYTPAFLGLDQPGGLWEQLGGSEQAGEDIIVGVIDTGVWPENLSYADRIDSKGRPTFDGGATLAYGAPPARWKGACQAGEGFTEEQCNNKLIGARYFDAGFRASGNALHWTEFQSPRDSLGGPAGMGGHGTHTSTTAAGNANVPALAPNGDMLALRSGIAPRARIAAYKVCWSFRPANAEVGNTCYDSDSIAAIEAAVTDGVDVLNYSITGGLSPLEPVEQAFRHAVTAGVFVAAAGGNYGPGNTVNHMGPWLATVAAATHDRTHTAAVTLANGQVFHGSSLNARALPAMPVIRAGAAVVAGGDSSFAQQCFGAEEAGAVQLDPAKVAGKIVACSRGFIEPARQVDVVKAAGGAGVILLDNGSGPTLSLYSLPTIYVGQADGEAIYAYAGTAGARAALSASELTPMYGPALADFSSRGPNVFDPGVMKPDMTAPGVDILAGISPSLSPAQRGAVVAGTGRAHSLSMYMSGTSMATPHVAGIAALLKQRHAGWSPSAIKSALMTSARTVLPTSLEGDMDGTLPWGQGAGLVVPNVSADPGLVYDITPAEYQRYVCGASGETVDCGQGSLPGHALNLASIALPGVVGNQTITRRVTNVGDTTALYNASTSLDGFDVTVTPATLQLAPGETRSYTVSLARTDAAHGAWKLGELVWEDGERKVRSPLQARYNSGVEAPAVVSATSTSGSRQIDVQAGFDGVMTAERGGMREYTRLAQTVTQAPAGSIESMDDVANACKARGAGVKAVSIGIPNNTVIARFEISNRDTEGGADNDLDLAVLDQYNQLVGYSGHADSNESVTLVKPGMGVAKICVLGYQLKNGSSTSFTLSYATAIPRDTRGSVKLALPAAVAQGGSYQVGVSWTGLEQGKHYLGGVHLLNPATGAGTVTQLDIDTRDVPREVPTGAFKRMRAER
ncbi:S8 family peptidase [Pseudoduganella albidiflava]|uniref:S8 family peptidase n=1 Tax=Pseudoduganella albidiflava TaxID=321983 RepID=A0ABX5RPD9_9BURK|nr:S8 family peptidase [Pseudoduganella albidiflava]